MQPLGEGKERWLTLDDQPADIHPYATLVRNLPGEHLGDAAAMGGRVDIPDPAAVEPRARLLHRRAKTVPFGRLEDLAKWVDRRGRERNAAQLTQHAVAESG